MAWIESHQELERHPKTLALTGLMNWDVDVTLGKLHRFWWWCVDYAEDGDLRKFNDSQLGNAVGIYGEQSKDFTRAMIAACWLDQAPYLRVHDWWSYFGRFLQVKYKNMPEKWKHIRELYNGCNNTPNNGCNNHITKPNLTKPNLTKDKETPLPPFQGGMVENLGDLPKETTANGLSPGGRSAQTTAGNPEKVPRNAPGIAPANPEVSNSVIRMESLINNLQTPKNGQYTAWFETAWRLYPASARVGKKLAFKHFRVSVKTTDDFALIKQALSIYLASKRVKNGYVQNATTWFNNWRDWLDYKEPESNVYDEDLVRDRVTGEVQHDPITGEALRVKRDPVTGKVIGSRWYTRPSIAQATK